jgi:hypothetical protein
MPHDRRCILLQRVHAGAEGHLGEAKHGDGVISAA